MNDRLDLGAALPTIETVAAMSDLELRLLLVHLAAHGQRIAALYAAVAARLETPPPTEPLWDVKQTAAYLNLSPDWVRDHGASLGIEACLDGTLRYDPEKVRALKDRRRNGSA